MPIYDYQCTCCGEKCEQIVKMDESDKKPCPNCGAEKEKLEKLPSHFAKHFSWGKWRVSV